MIWLYLIIAFNIGLLVGWAICMYEADFRCPWDNCKTMHKFEYIGTDTSDVTIKKYRCRKCGYIKTVKQNE